MGDRNDVQTPNLVKNSVKIEAKHENYNFSPKLLYTTGPSKLK